MTGKQSLWIGKKKREAIIFLKVLNWKDKQNHSYTCHQVPSAKSISFIQYKTHDHIFKKMKNIASVLGLCLWEGVSSFELALYKYYITTILHNKCEKEFLIVPLDNA